MKKTISILLALCIAIMSFSVTVFAVELDAQTAMEENKKLVLAAVEKTTVTNEFTQDDLDDLVLDACTYKINEYASPSVSTDNFKLTAATVDAVGAMEASVTIAQNDGSVTFSVKKEIPKLTVANTAVTEKPVITAKPESTVKPTQSSALSPKEDLAAAKKAIYDAIYTEFAPTNDTTEADVLAFAKSKIPAGSSTVISAIDSFEMTKSKSTASGKVNATLTLTCGTLTEKYTAAKSIPMLVTNDSLNIEADKSLMGKAVHTLSFSNKITKDEMLEAVLGAVKHGTTAVWESFAKTDATFDEAGKTVGTLKLTLNGETRTLRLSDEIPKLVRNIPSNKISVTQEEWGVLRITNIERFKAGVVLLSMPGALQDAMDIRAHELTSFYSHTRPDGGKPFSAVKSSFSSGRDMGENIAACQKTPAEVMDTWMNSDGHRKNILTAKFTYMGVGFEKANVNYWGQMFSSGEGITSVSSSTGSFTFADTEEMQKEYLICTSSDGIESYMPLDPGYMTKTDSGYTLNIFSVNPVTITVVTSSESSTPTKLTAASFTDVMTYDYFAKAVSWAVEKNITSGTSATTFSPNDTCTRAHIITFLWRAVGSPKSNTANPFFDVKTSDYFYDAALWASEKGIVKGATFNGSTPCTRSSTVMYIWLCAECPDAEVSGKFNDVPQNAEYAQAVSWAVEEGITSGTSENTFSPETICDRGQIVTFLYRTLK